LNVDWQHYIDEDDEDGEEGTQMPNFGNEHSFPGFGGGDDELPDEDDEPIQDNGGKYIII
jgi:hypothetical protein